MKFNEWMRGERFGQNAPCVVIADGTDNPGGGGYNDTTPVLQALLDAGIQNAAIGTIYDPGTVQQAIAAGVGGQPGTRKSTGKMSSTGPASSDASPRTLQPSAQLPSATTRRGSGIAW